MPAAKLLILRVFMIRNQQVAGSSPAGGSSAQELTALGHDHRSVSMHIG